jgi:hypothetical protein
MKRQVLYSVSAMALASLVACGGSDPAPAASSSSTLGGTAAVGVPIVAGSVTVTCAGGSAIPTTTTGTDGAWTVTISGQTFPCAVQVKQGTVNGAANSAAYHSIAFTAGTVNVSPLTDLVVANLAGTSPASWFGALNGATLQKVTANSLNTSTTAVLSGLGIASSLGTNSPFTTPFKPVAGNTIDDILEALAKAGAQYSDLLTAAAKSGTFVKPVGFDFGTAFKSTQSGAGTSSGTGTTTGTSTSGGTGTTTGASTLTIEFSSSGLGAVAFPAVTLSNVPEPTSQTEFCGALSSDANLKAMEATGGKLTIDSCSFANRVGSISATLAMTTPISMNLSYTVKYTYSGTASGTTTTSTTSTTTTSSTACSGTNLIFSGSATGGPVKSGDAVCFTTATATNLNFTLPTGPVTLGNPTKDSGGFTQFTDANSRLGYEVIFDSANKVQEINVVNTAVAASANNYFVGQFAPDPAVACPAKGGTVIPTGQVMAGACKMPQTTQAACTAAGYFFEPLGGGVCWTYP